VAYSKLYLATKHVLNNYNFTFNLPTPQQQQLYNNAVAKNGWVWAKHLVGVMGGYYCINTPQGVVATRIYKNGAKWGSHSHPIHAHGYHTLVYAIAQRIAKNAMYRTTNCSSIQQWFTTYPTL